jgi:predicted DNA-binding transcriptional regulator AlpA
MQAATWSGKQSIKEHELSNPNQSTRDFRAVFYELDPAVLITADEFAALMCVTRASFDFRLHIGKVPDPVIRENRCVRWRVSDVRKWLEAMQQVPPDPGRALGGRAQRIIAREAAGLPRRDHRRKSDAQ